MGSLLPFRTKFSLVWEHEKGDRYDLLPSANSVTLAVHANRVCVHPSFSLSRLTAWQPPNHPFSNHFSLSLSYWLLCWCGVLLRCRSVLYAISQSDWLPPLLSACQHFYTYIPSCPMRARETHCSPPEYMYEYTGKYTINDACSSMWSSFNDETLPTLSA